MRKFQKATAVIMAAALAATGCSSGRMPSSDRPAAFRHRGSQDRGGWRRR